MSNNFLELVNKRYSIRDYVDKPVERDKLDLCLEAARVAPSACNSQPWKFVVVDDVNLKNELCAKIFSGIYSMNKFVKKAPVLLAVVSEKGSFVARVGAQLRDTRYYLIDIGIAVEHFVLQATELGLGTCWIGWFNEREAKKVLNIPYDKRIDIIVSVGYSEQQKRQKVRQTLDQISWYNKTK